MESQNIIIWKRPTRIIECNSCILIVLESRLILGQAMTAESCDSKEKRLILLPQTHGTGGHRCWTGVVAFCLAETGGKIDSAIQVQGVSRSSSDKCKVNSPESCRYTFGFRLWC